MTLEDIARVRDEFVAVASRAYEVVFQWLELNFAHGYLAQRFFSEHFNQRTDAYGGNYENRSRYLRESLPPYARFGRIIFL
jgi:2,4-dienoyl-CoA reductase-like NADH-dependent reductase (Old Yellow Enzyme family)